MKAPSLPEEGPKTILDQVIIATENNLKQQKNLRSMIEEYILLQKTYMQDTSNKELSFKLVLQAHEVLEQIKKLQLTQSFSQEFLSELTFFSNIAERRNPK